MASQGQPSRNAPSGPLLMHFWQPMQRYGSTSMRPKGVWSSSGTQNMHASMGQYSMHAGEPAQPVQQSVVMARMRGFFFRVALPSPTDIGQCFSTIPIMRLQLRTETFGKVTDTLTCPKCALNELIGPVTFRVRIGTQRFQSAMSV